MKMSYLEREIREQPAVLERLLAQEGGSARRLAEAMLKRRIQYVMVAARGTSDNAGRYGNYLFAAMNQMPVALATPSLFSVYEKPPRFGDCLVLGISQSGQSPDIVSVLAEARPPGCAYGRDHQRSYVAAGHNCRSSAGATRRPGAECGRHQDLHGRAGRHCPAERHAGRRGNAALEALSAVPDAAARTLELAPEVVHIAERYRFMDRCVVLGRGYNYATAFEVALKLTETNYIAAEPYSPADFLHGPLAMLDENLSRHRARADWADPP